MELIDEEDCAPPGRLQLDPRFREQVAHLLDSGRRRVHLAKAAPGLIRNNVRQCRFARAGRAVKNHGAEPIGLQQSAQQLARPEEMLLADELVQSARPHPRRERLGAAQVFFMGLLEEIDGISLLRGRDWG